MHFALPGFCFLLPSLVKTTALYIYHVGFACLLTNRMILVAADNAYRMKHAKPPLMELDRLSYNH